MMVLIARKFKEEQLLLETFSPKMHIVLDICKRLIISSYSTFKLTIGPLTLLPDFLHHGLYCRWLWPRRFSSYQMLEHTKSIEARSVYYKVCDPMHHRCCHRSRWKKCQSDGKKLCENDILFSASLKGYSVAMWNIRTCCSNSAHQF